MTLAVTNQEIEEQDISIRIRSGNTIFFLNDEDEVVKSQGLASKLKPSVYARDRKQITKDIRERFGHDVHISTIER